MFNQGLPKFANINKLYLYELQRFNFLSTVHSFHWAEHSSSFCRWYGDQPAGAGPEIRGDLCTAVLIITQTYTINSLMKRKATQSRKKPTAQAYVTVLNMSETNDWINRSIFLWLIFQVQVQGQTGANWMGLVGHKTFIRAHFLTLTKWVFPRAKFLFLVNFSIFC